MECEGKGVVKGWLQSWKNGAVIYWDKKRSGNLKADMRIREAFAFKVDGW